MGSGRYDIDNATARATFRSMHSASVSAHTDAIKSGKTKAGLHPDLNVRNKLRRECRDNDDNPTAFPIVVMLDVTGSMTRIPDLLVNELPKLVAAVRDRGVIEHPALLNIAVGDANSDQAPLQVGEFESSDELIEAHLSKVWLEGKGGGQYSESYDLGLLYVNDCVDTDHWDKRGGKGLLVVIGDEGFYDPVQVKHFEKLTGQAAENRTMASLLNALQTKWDVFVIRPGGTSCFEMATVRDRWRSVLPAERVIDVEDWHDINGLIAGTASIVGGASLDTTVDNLKSAGINTDGITTALAQIASSTELAGRVDEEPSEAARI